jgi:hypothetical protein
MNDANLNSINGADERKSKTPRAVIVAALTEKLHTEEGKAPGDWRHGSFQPPFLFHNQRRRNQR